MLVICLNICLFQTGNVFGVVCAHVILGMTDNDRQQISANMYLVTDINEIIISFAEDGWSLLKAENQLYVLEKEGKYKNIIFLQHTVTDYDVVIISDELNDTLQDDK